MPEPGREETVRVVALDKNFHMKCYKCEVGRPCGPRGWEVVGALPGSSAGVLRWSVAVLMPARPSCFCHCGK